MHNIRTLAAVAAVAITVGLGGCASEDSDGITELADGKWGTGEVLTDPAALATRVPTVAGAEAVHYVGGTLTEPDNPRELTVPGPSDFWIDAVVDFGSASDVPIELSCPAGETAAGQAMPSALDGFVADGPLIACGTGSATVGGWSGSIEVNLEAGQVLLHLTQY